jgi:hypothetical protein
MAHIPNPFDGDISDEAVQAWLQQFSREHRAITLKLLSAFRYYSSRKVAALVKELYATVMTQLGNPMDKTWFVPVGYVAKSGSIIAYYFRTQNNLPQDRFVAPGDIASLPLTKGEAVVFLDDFVGSGHQAHQVWQTVVEPIRKSSRCRFAYAVLVGYQDGLERVRASTGFVTLALQALTEKDRPFSAEGSLFADSTEKAHARGIIETYGRRLYPNHPLGYEESQGLIGFFYSTPNNSLPIFWSSEAGWHPLLAHGESYRDPAFLIGPPPGLTRESTSNSPRKPLVDSKELDRYDIDPNIAINIFSEFHKAPIFLVLAPVLRELGIGNPVFTELLKLTADLKYHEHEKQPVCSALLFVPINMPERLIGMKMLSAGSVVSVKSTEEILALARLVNGFNGAVVFWANGKALGDFLYGHDEYQDDLFLPLAYHPAAAASLRSSGFLMLFSGTGRVTLFYKGQRILSYRNAMWHLYTAELDRGIRNLSSCHGVDVPVLDEVFRLAIRLSDEGKGALITVGDHEAVIKFSDPPNTGHIRWEEMRLDESPDEAILGLMAQDGATIISGSGQVVQGMTILRPPAGTEADEEVGKGSKHSTAAKISKVTGSICVAVSVDGRVTAYSRGTIAFKIMG